MLPLPLPSNPLHTRTNIILALLICHSFGHDVAHARMWGQILWPVVQEWSQPSSSEHPPSIRRPTQVVLGPPESVSDAVIKHRGYKERVCVCVCVDVMSPFGWYSYITIGSDGAKLFIVWDHALWPVGQWYFQASSLQPTQRVAGDPESVSDTINKRNNIKDSGWMCGVTNWSWRMYFFNGTWSRHCC